MNILLPTYSYQPYNYGGTEIYVSGLAEYLTSKGHQVTIIAGMPPKAFEDYALFFEDTYLRTVEYFQDKIRVIGVILKETTVTDIYRKRRSEWEISWNAVFKKLNISCWDLLHIHANTSAIGNSLIKGAKLHSPNIKVIASYHLPVSCVKGTLLFGNKMELCPVKPSVTICSACFTSDKKQLPLSLSKWIISVLPRLGNKKLPTQLRIKYLVKEFIHSFESFDKEIDQWHVFSEQIRSILLLNNIELNKVLLLRHGVNPVFNLNSDVSIVKRKNLKQTTFLYVGRFDKTKGFSTLLKAWCSLNETTDRILCIIGEQQNENKTFDKWMTIAEMRKDIKWFGRKESQEIAELMKEVHCTIIPSEWIEIGPLVFHEAIASGSDVIASDLGGCRELAKRYMEKSSSFEAGNVVALTKSIKTFNYSGVKLKVATDLQNYSSVFQSYSKLVKKHS